MIEKQKKRMPKANKLQRAFDQSIGFKSDSVCLENPLTSLYNKFIRKRTNYWKKSFAAY